MRLLDPTVVPDDTRWQSFHLHLRPVHWIFIFSQSLQFVSKYWSIKNGKLLFPKTKILTGNISCILSVRELYFV